MCGPKLPHPKPAAEPRRRSRIAVLEGLVDHTNVGSAFRNAAALGLDAVLVSPTCADPLYRRSVRVSMGTVFQVPWTRIPSGRRVFTSCRRPATSWPA
ncbi:TrmH family RNA methyltransferase [Tessaracoccus coleopterorum]|uniref:TrmH family RNA methyltransferase n=1 Tax=Tessaracoccus coleopterorum TaxID=2714950 RepID=UPI002F90C4B0